MVGNGEPDPLDPLLELASEGLVGGESIKMELLSGGVTGGVSKTFVKQKIIN